MRSFVPWFVVVALSTGCFGTETARAHGPEHDRLEAVRSNAMDRYHAGDYRTFVEMMEAVAAHSDNDVDDYNLACGYALNGQLDEALAKLEYLVERGSGFDLVDDEDFLALRSRPEFYQLVAKSAFHEEADRQLEPVRDMAMEKYHAGHYEIFVQIMEKIANVSNNDKDLYNLACGYALNGQREEAIATLQHLADHGSDYGVEGDSDFDSLRHDPRFQAIVDRLSH